MHSPSKNKNIQDMDTEARLTGSVPNLTSIEFSEAEPIKKSFRKRKMPLESDFTQQFNEFKREILEILTVSSKSQNDNLQKISENITAIKDQLNDLNSTTQHLMSENHAIKQQIANLTSNVSETEDKIKELQEDVQLVKSSLHTSVKTSPSAIYNELLAEMEDRKERDKNIIVTGIPEQYTENKQQRQDTDKREIRNKISTIYPECPPPEKIIRIGKFDSSKPRPIKVCYAVPETVKTILRNKRNVELDSIKIYSDKTPYQQQQMKILQEELKTRTKNGETNITIKYIKGIPKIINNHPKN